MGTKISALTTTGSAPTGAYLPLAFEGENYKVPAGTLVESGEISFRANLGGANWLANAGLYVQIPAMSTTAFNVGSAFDTSNFRFTPGVAGRYLLTGALSMAASISFALLVLKNNTSSSGSGLTASADSIFPSSSTTNFGSVNTAAVFTTIVEANDTDWYQFALQLETSSGYVEGDIDFTFFAGCKI